MILAIDTSVAISISLVNGAGVEIALANDVAPEIHNVTIDESGSQGELTAWYIEGALRNLGISVDDIDEVVVGVGPGPFTGLRVGIATGEVFAFARGIPVIGVCSLDAIGYAAQRECVVVTNARRKELYWARYDVTGRRVEGPAVDFPAVIADKFAGQEFVGPGVEIYPELINGENISLHASDLVLAFRTHKAESLPISPLYLRAPDAVEPAPRKGTLQPVMDVPGEGQ